MKNQIIEKSCKGKKYALVVSRFNDFVTTKLLKAAQDTLRQEGVLGTAIRVVWVPGAFEIPLAAKRLAQSKKVDAVICLGALIRGETPHFDFIAQAVSHAIARTGIETNVPVIFGVLTTNTVEQALDRAGGKMGNKGRESALAAIHMTHLLEQL